MHSGFGLSDLLISLSVGMILCISFLTAHSHQVNQRTRIRSDLDLMSVRRDLRTSLSHTPTCLRNFAQPSFRINETQIGMTGYDIRLPKIVEATDPENTLAEAGLPLQDLPGLQVETIRALNISKLSANRFRFDLSLGLKNADGTMRSILLSGFRVSTDPASPPNAKAPISCGDSAPTVGRNCRIVRTMGTLNVEAIAYCAADEVVVGGGGNCLTGDAQEWPSDGSLNDTHIASMITSHAYLKGPTQGWYVDCFNINAGFSDFAKSLAFANCCK